MLYFYLTSTIAEPFRIPESNTLYSTSLDVAAHTQSSRVLRIDK